MNLVKKIIPFCFSVFFCAIMWAQCPEDIVILETQLQVDSFPELYPNCTELSSTLVIGDLSTFDPSDIVDISPLNQITSVGGNLSILSNPYLSDLSGLNNLTSIGGFLYVGYHENLTDLSGLNQITSIGNSLKVELNFGLSSLSGLDNLVSIGGSLSILLNPDLGSLNGLDNITSVGDYLEIKFNNNLMNLNSLDNLTSVGDYLEIRGNGNLMSLSGLDGLTSIGGALSIQSNASLTDLFGIENIDYNTISYLSIYENPMLSICYVSSICNYLENGGSSDIYDNAALCNENEEILLVCIVSTTTPDDLSHITIAPNPTDDTFIIQGISAGTYQILNTSGQTIRQGDIENNLLIDISRETQGVYFISITVDDATFVRRIVKM